MRKKLFALCDFEDGYSTTIEVKRYQINLLMNNKEYADAYRKHGKCVKKLFYEFF